MTHYRYCVIGAGIVGLSTAYHLLLDDPEASVVVLEREDAVATHQTGHNSGVIHSGIYYEPGSLKATFSKAGERATKEFCTEHGIAFDECGKLIVATDPAEVERMAALEDRAGGERHRMPAHGTARSWPNSNRTSPAWRPCTCPAPGSWTTARWRPCWPG